MSRFAPMPDPPYYAVIFTAQRSGVEAGYNQMAEKMESMAQEQPGYIGIESTRDTDGLGITVSYWRDEAALLGWKQVSQHLLAQKMGKERWYEFYALRIARVERGYTGPQDR